MKHTEEWSIACHRVKTSVNQELRINTVHQWLPEKIPTRNVFDRKRKHLSQKSLHKRVRLCDETSIISYLVFRNKNVEGFDIEGGESS